MNKTFRFLSTLALGAMIAIGATSCGKNNNSNPDPKKEVHEDEVEPQKVVLTFAPGHFHGATSFHQTSVPAGLKHIQSEVRFVFEHKDNAWVLTDDSAKTLFVEAAGEDAVYINPYGLWISYFDKDGKEMTGTFVEDAMERQFQHFFQVANLRTLDDKAITGDKAKTPKVFEYVYMDSNPWNEQIKKGAKLVGSKVLAEKKGELYQYEPLQPVGLKGFFNFIPQSVKFDLKIDLIHTPEGKYVDGKACPYYSPKATAHSDATLVIPVVAFMKKTDLEKFYHKDDDTETDVDSYEELSEEGQGLVDLIAKIFGISREDAFRELHSRLNDFTPDTSSLYF